MVAFLEKPEGSTKFHQIVDFLNSTHIKYALTENPTIYVSLIHQFWQTTSASTSKNGEMKITATIDGRVKTVTEASIKRHLKLEDSNGEGQTVPVESHHTPIDALSISSPHISLTLRSPIRQETKVPQLSSPPHINVADEAASTGQGSGNINKTPSMPYDSPLPRDHTLGSNEGRMQQNELIDLVTKLLDICDALETDLRLTKKVYGDALTKLIKKVKKLEKIVKSSQARRKARVVVSDNEEELEDPSKQGRKIAKIDQDPSISLVQDEGTSWFQEDAYIQGKNSADTEILLDQEEPTKLLEDLDSGEKGEKEVSTASPEVKVAAESLVYIRRSASKRKDKGKDVIKEAEPVQKKTKLQLEQERLGYEEALRLQEQLDEEERQRINRVHEEAKLINQRKKHFAQQRAKERRNKPLTQTQQRTYMSNYIKHMGSHTLQQLKKLSFDEIKELFETTIKRVKDFVPMESDDTVPKVVAGRSKRDAEEELNQESSKRQKIREGSEPAEELKDKESDKLSQEQLQQLMIIVPKEGMNVEALQTKYPIIDWEVYTEDSRMDDLVKLWSLVHEKFNSIESTKDKERELWVELKRVFEPINDNELWKS
ncbi:hypothetical protein Tco_0997781 [Tanacetum coccineum]